MDLGSYSQKALWGQDSLIWEDGAWQMGPSYCLPPSINGLICMPCRGPVASLVCALKHLEHPTEQLLPASLLLAMAWWCLVLLLIGTLLAGEPSLGLAHLGVG